MKLLTWMHRKLRQNNSEMLNEFPLGQTILNNQQLCSKQNYGNGTTAHQPRDSHARNSFASLEYVGLDALDTDLPTEFSGHFHGFLAIGTLGAETFISEPETPTFSISVDNIAERETEVTESELKLINDELEKVLGAEAKEDSWTDSSGRNSYISTGRNSYMSTGRSSHASTITLGGKVMEIIDSNGNGKTTCPLQGYLFGSAVELPDRAIATKKENRTSLGELFQRHKAEEFSGSKSERGEKRSDKDGDKTAMNLINKILKRKIAHASSKTTSSATGGGGATESTSAETKLHKMLHVFHKKVHPESQTCMPRLSAQYRCGTKNRASSKSDNGYGGHMLPDEDFTTVPNGTAEKRYVCHYKRQADPNQIALDGSDSNGNREFWIKSDADYLVLEL